jgi:hypothetical protein
MADRAGGRQSNEMSTKRSIVNLRTGPKRNAAKRRCYRYGEMNGPVRRTGPVF